MSGAEGLMPSTACRSKPGASASRRGSRPRIEAKPSYAQFRIVGLDDDRARTGPRRSLRPERSGTDHPQQRNWSARASEPTFRKRSDWDGADLCFADRSCDPPGELTDLHITNYLRVATPPLFTPDGKPFGIIIANIDMRPALNRIRSSTNSGEEIYAVNSYGDYLVHPDRGARIRGAHRVVPPTGAMIFRFFPAWSARRPYPRTPHDRSGRAGPAVRAAIAPGAACRNGSAIIVIVPPSVFWAACRPPFEGHTSCSSASLAVLARGLHSRVLVGALPELARSDG